MFGLSNWSMHKSWDLITIFVLVALVASCGQLAATPTPIPSPTPAPAPKVAPTMETTPQAKEAKPEAKEARPQAKEPAKAVKGLLKLKVPFTSVAGTNSIPWMAKEKGLFEKYGLDVELQYTPQSHTVPAAMMSGEVVIAQGSGDATINANLAGGDFVFLAVMANVLTFSMYATPEIKRVEDLKGKVIGVSNIGGTVEYGARWVLKKYGLEPGKDVAIVAVGGNPEAIAAMKAGGVQAGIFGVPNTVKARQAGMHELVGFFELGVPYPMVSVITRKPYLAANEEVVRNFLKAYLEGIAVAKKDKEFAKKVIGKYSQTEDPEALEETYEYYITKIFPKAPYPKTEAIQAVLDQIAVQNPKASEVKPETYIDSRILKELDESGFINNLYPN